MTLLRVGGIVPKEMQSIRRAQHHHRRESIDARRGHRHASGPRRNPRASSIRCLRERRNPRRTIMNDHFGGRAYHNRSHIRVGGGTGRCVQRRVDRLGCDERICRAIKRLILMVDAGRRAIRNYHVDDVADLIRTDELDRRREPGLGRDTSPSRTFGSRG